MASLGLREVPAGGDETDLDAEQSDAAPGGGGVCCGVPVRTRSVGESHGGGVDRCRDRTRCAGWTSGAEEKDGYGRGAQLDILGDRMIENVYFTYFAVVGMVSLWLPVLFFARGATTDFLRGLAMKAGHNHWGANAMFETWWGRTLVTSRWSRGLYAALKCLCFCYLGLELALTRGPVALVGAVATDVHAMIRVGAHVLTWMTAAFCLLRGVPVLSEGWKYFASSVGSQRKVKSAA